MEGGSPDVILDFFPQINLYGIREMMYDLNQDNRDPNTDLNRSPVEQERFLHTRQRSLVRGFRLAPISLVLPYLFLYP
jgi:hypothetical protein